MAGLARPDNCWETSLRGRQPPNTCTEGRGFEEPVLHPLQPCMAEEANAALWDLQAWGLGCGRERGVGGRAGLATLALGRGDRRDDKGWTPGKETALSL